MRMLIVTGGTGGHIYPALALADSAKKRYKNIEILFVGNDDRMEANLIPQMGYAFQALHACGLNGSIVHKAKAMVLMTRAYRKAFHIIDEFRPDVAIGFGGYVSAPVMLAAHRKNVKTLIHEQNSVLGIANKLVMKYVDGIVICYDRLFLELDRSKTRQLGNPRASSAVQVNFDQTYFTSLGLDIYKPLILVVMGSLGSTSINDMMCEALPKVNQGYQILMVSGKHNYETVCEKMPKQANIYVTEYVRQLDIMKHVDLLICRAGATTAAEITALGTPSILIPSPYVANNHQYYNAKVLVDKKAALMIEEKDLTATLLNKNIEFIMTNQILREEMKQNALALGFPHASEAILAWVDEMKR